MEDKFKSRKFILMIVWQLFIITSFILMFALKKYVSVLGDVLNYSALATAAYLVAQGISDVKKIEQERMKSRKFWVTILQVGYAVIGFILYVYLNQFKQADVGLLRAVILNAGAATTAYMGIAGVKAFEQKDKRKL